MKKQILLTALTLTLLASAVMTAPAEEVVATILFGPEKVYGYTLAYSYAIDTTGNGVIDRKLLAVLSSKTDPVFDILTKYYLKEGIKFKFENSGLNPFEEVWITRMTEIEVNGRMVELSEMVPLEEVKQRLPYLYAKLVREGRAR
jgi:hypothetical protein